MSVLFICIKSYCKLSESVKDVFALPIIATLIVLLMVAVSGWWVEMCRGYAY